MSFPVLIILKTEKRYNLQEKQMKKFILFLCSIVLLSACAPRPQYKTAKGKKKLKHYNSIQHQ